MVNYIYRKQEFHNPFKIDYGNTTKEIKEIIIYNDKKEVFKFDWFINKENADRFGNYPADLFRVNFSQEIKCKRKVNFDGSIFFISIKPNYRFEKNNVTLYIPLEEISPQEYKRKVVNCNTHTEDKVIYKLKDKEIYFGTYENERQTNENLREEIINKLISNSKFNDIDIGKFEELKELVSKIDEVKKLKPEQISRYKILEGLGND